MFLPELIFLLGLTQAGPQARPAPPCAVEGAVTDVSGSPLPGVTVVVGGRGTPVVTDDEGRYCVVGLELGRYRVTLALAGFSPATSDVTVPAAGGGEWNATVAQSFAESVVVTGTRTVRMLDTVPVRTEIISKDTIAAIGARSLAEAMEFSTGVRVENNCQNCNFSQIRLLGLEGPYTQILVDGQPVISSLAQVYGIEQIPARLIERIEVVKGGGSAPTTA
jgi:outer membrane receptor for ferrienterochelin and colicins